jgi:hypothetical protein
VTKIIFDANCLGFKVGMKEDVDDALAKTLCNAGAAHEEGKEAMKPNAKKAAKKTLKKA